MRDLPKEDRLAIFSLSAGHFINDAYSNFLGPLLPLLILKLNLSIAQAGWLAALQVISSSFTQPAYGYISDRYLKRLFAVFSPLVTVIFMSFLGVAPNYFTLALLLLCGGVGIASFHPQSAALAASASRHRKGLGMSIFVTAGTIGYSLGPVIITSAVATVGLERSYWVMIPGVLVFALLYFSVPATPHSTMIREKVNLKVAIRAVWYPLLILFLLVVIRSALQICFVNFLPLYFSQKGATPTMAGKMTTLFLFSGAVGGFCGGAVADRFGGRNVISWSMFCSTPLLLAFLLNGGGLAYVFLAAAGLALLSTLPVNVVMAQNLMPHSSSVVSSLMMGLAWGTGGMVVPVIGKIADVAGLAHALMAVSVLPILGFILAQFLPTRYIE